MQCTTGPPQRQSLTCEPVVDVVVSLPQPENGLGLRMHLIQTFGRHVLKVIGTSPAAEEAPDVGSHGLQHLLRVWAEIARGRVSRCHGQRRFIFLR